MSSVLPPLSVGDVLAERYRLDDEITVRPDTQIWRAWDNRLQRRVSIRLVADEAPFAADVREAALRAAKVDERNLLPVLDIIDTDHLLAIISDWTDWPTIDYLISEPKHPLAAIDINLAAARAMRALHDSDAVHGCLRPGSVHMDGDNSVKLRGYEVDAALKQLHQTREDARLQDVQGLLNVLYLTLTGRWPEPDRRGRIAAPSRLTSDVPTELDDLWSRQCEAVRLGTASVAGLQIDLSAARASILARSGRRTRLPVGTYLARGAALVIVALAVATLTMTGITQASQQRQAVEARTAVETEDGLLSGEVAQESPVNPDERPIPVISMRTLDPDGDGSEYPHLLPNITDGDSGTAWTTKPYYTDDIGGKRGIGVVFDLGYPQPVTAIDLELIGNSTDFTVAVGNDPYGSLDDYLPVANVQSAGQDVFVRIPRAVEARAVVVWFTQMSEMSNWSWVESGYRAGIRSATIYGNGEAETP